MRAIPRLFGLALCLTAFGGVAIGGEEGPAPPAAGAEDEDEIDPTPPALDERTKEAIAKGVAWLRTRANAEGWWGEVHNGRESRTYDGGTNVYKNPYGATALALYTLLKCGVPPQDPLVRKGFAWLRKRESNGGNSYEISMKLLAVTATADPFKRGKESASAGEKVRLVGEMRTWAQELVEALVRRRAPDGWRYDGKGDKNAGGAQDTSSTQLAALALFSADRCGLRIEPDVWAGVIRWNLAQQEREGPAHPRAVVARPPKGTKPEGSPPSPGQAEDRARGFAYILGKAKDEDDRVPTGGMTACGVGSLMMARFALLTRHPKAWEKEDAAAIQRSIYDGLAWMDKNWQTFDNPKTRRWPLYYVYCVERAMDLVGGHRLGKKFWYVEMAGAVLHHQQTNGRWDTGRARRVGGDVLDTCFALLFLRRATRGGIPFPSVTGGSDLGPADGR